MEESKENELEYGRLKQLMAVFAAAAIIFIIAPLLLMFFSFYIDTNLGLSRFFFDLINIFIGFPVLMAGVFLILWSAYVQYTLGKGTPLPLVPTLKLVVRGPYSFCRNPMALGITLYISGISIWIGSLSALILSFVLFSFIVIYNKLIEENELLGRFGNDYLDYIRDTPFIMPKLKSKKKP